MFKIKKSNYLSYRECSRCVMDTSDPKIAFNSLGYCNHCIEFKENISANLKNTPEGRKEFDEIIKKIKLEGVGKEYDCIIGLSGGIDSSFLALKLKDYGLRPLVMHIDAGWNSELAVSNIESLVKYCDYDLYTHVINWNEMRDLQLAYLKAGISNQDVPQDHIFAASIYHFAVKKKIKFILSGGNYATEGIYPSTWEVSAMDSINLKAIHKKFGKLKLSDFKTISFFDQYFWYPIIKGMRVIRPLNYINYNKFEATKELEKTVNFKSYPRKHGESLFTKLFQNYYLPYKFGFDKRRPHLSSLIMSNQLTREQSKILLEEDLYEKNELNYDINYLCKKLNISREEFKTLIEQNNRHYSEFDNWDKYYKLTKKIQRLASRFLGKSFRFYS